MSERDTHALETNALLAGVDAAYRHYSKRVTPDAPLHLMRVALKWYDIYREDRPVPEGIQRMAREYLESEARNGRLEAKGLGFTLLHRCGEAFYFLIVSTWNHSNELWESVYYKDGDRMDGFAPFPRDGEHKPTFCVWELGPVWHEQRAWSRLLASSRAEDDVRAYLDDRFEGSV